MHLNYIKEFGLGLFLLNGFTRVLRILNFNKFITKYEKKKYRRIVKWLDKKYGKFIADEPNNNVHISEDCCIWIFWWQGESSMPSIVKSCFESVKRNCQQHPVVLVTKDNYAMYTNIPSYIFDKVKLGLISLTHLSDIIRENLLYLHGGIWMDATVYMTDPFDAEIYNYTYYSLKGVFDLFDWTGFFQASAKGNILTKYMCELFNMYWKDHNCLITYLLIDCFISLVREKNSFVCDMIEKLPFVGKDIFILNDMYLDKEFDEDKLKEISINSNIHKLSYKFKHETDANGKITFYGKIIDRDFKG